VQRRHEQGIAVRDVVVNVAAETQDMHATGEPERAGELPKLLFSRADAHKMQVNVCGETYSSHCLNS
jgi:hypothetical protein